MMGYRELDCYSKNVILSILFISMKLVIKCSAFIIQNIGKQKMEKDMSESKILEDYIEQQEKQESEAIIAKKTYLKQNILDVYSSQPEKIDKFLQFFLHYVKKVKGIQTDDHNLDHLTFSQLKHLVTQFCRFCPPQENDILRAQNTTQTNLTTVVQLKEEQFDAKKVYYSNGSWDYQLVGYEQCKKVKEFFAVDGDYSSHIVLFEKQQVKKVGGFFGIGGSYQLWIQMRSNLFKEMVSRKVQDFVALKKVLSNVYPYVFIYPLEITQKQLEKVNQQPVRTSIVNQCRKFINYVCKSELLLQNFNTHRFFKELNYQNYMNHQKKHPKEMINRIRMIQNADGCVSIEISDKNELTKKDFIRKGNQLQMVWARLQESNLIISNKLKQVQVQINKQKKDIQRMVIQFTNVNPLLKSKAYDKTVQSIICYNQIVKNYDQHINNFQLLFQSINLQVASQSKKLWKFFNVYAKDIYQLDQEYYLRRKVFLEKEQKKNTQANDKEKQAQNKESEQLDPINKSIINKLGIASNNVKDGIKETVWIQRFSKWQAYINKQFTHSFERLLENDADILKKILRQNLSHKREMLSKQDEMIHSLQQVFLISQQKDGKKQ